MEKVFRIGSSRKYNDSYSLPSHTTAKVVWEYVTLNGEYFLAGAVFTEGDYLAASMCAPVGDSELEFCQALLRKAYGRPRQRSLLVRERHYEGVNICGRKFRKCTNPRPWVNIGNVENEDGSLGADVWEFRLKPSVLLSNNRR